jgi:glycosyltransferase involved in cell wall biosynthesis
MKIAVLTMVFNERHFLPIWIAHYGAVVGRENLYVVDDGSDDGSTSKLGAVKVLRGKKEVLDEDQRAAKLSAIQAELLTLYDVVIVTDADELIVVDPNLGMSLTEYIDKRVPIVTATVGFNLHYNMFEDAPLQPDLPLLRQRHFVQADYSYCKPLVSRVPLRWRPGFHTCEFYVDLNRDLVLFHLRAVDADIAYSRLRALNRVQRSTNAVDKGHSAHFEWDRETYLNKIFFTRKEDFDAALPESEFDNAMQRMITLHAALDYDALEQLKPQLLRLPARFADCLAPPAGL